MIEVKVENTLEAKMDLKPASEKKVQKPLSFSISSILGESDQKKSEDTDMPRVPATYYGTIHHFGHPESTHYQHFESQLPPRACSTPENEYPSPTPNVVPTAYRTLQSQALTPNSYPFQQNQDSSYFIPHRNGASPVTRHIDNISPEPEIHIPRHSNNHLFEKSSDKSLDSMGESYQYSPSPLKAKKKKTRTVFSRSQVYQLESAFDMKRYLSSTERSGLASSLNLSETQIKIWFQNRRNKWKRQINGEMDEIPIPPAFAASYMPSPLAQPPSLNSYTCSSIIDSREAFLRGGLAVPTYYSHPYARESRLRETYLSALK